MILDKTSGIKILPLHKLLLLLFMLFLLGSCNNGSSEHLNKVAKESTYTPILFFTPSPDSSAAPEIEAFDERKFKSYPIRKEVISESVNIDSMVIAPGRLEVSLHVSQDSILRKQITVQSVKAMPEQQPGFFPEVSIAKDMAHTAINPLGISYFGKLQGLKHDYVCDLLEDKSGNLWIATRGGGVSKYDGRYFTHFNEKEGFFSNDIWALMEDRKGTIWIGSNGDGIVCYEGNMENTACRLGRCKHDFSRPEDRLVHQKKTSHSYLVYNERSGLQDNKIRKFFEDRQGRIWIATSNGLSVFNGETFTRIPPEFFPSGQVIFSIDQDSQGYIWIAADRGSLIRLNYERLQHPCLRQTCSHKPDNLLEWNQHRRERNRSVTCFQIASKGEKEGAYIYEIINDRNRNVWLATDYGVVKMNAEYLHDSCFNSTCRHDLVNRQDYAEHNSHLSLLFSLYDSNHGLSSNYVLDLMEDRQGYIWAGTYGGGVNKFDGTCFKQITMKDGLSTNEIFVVLQDRTDNFWIGGRNGGLNKYNPANFRHYSSDSTFGKGVLNIIKEHTNRIWLSTEMGHLISFENNTFFNHIPEGIPGKMTINTLVADKTGNLWQSLWGGGLRKLKGNRIWNINRLSGVNSPQVNDMVLDDSENLWISTWSNGLVRLDGKSLMSWSSAQGLSDNYPTSLARDLNGNIWVGMFNGSISILQPVQPNNPCNKKRCLHNTASQQELETHRRNCSYTIRILPNPYQHVHSINSILPDREGKVWIGSRGKGIRYIDGNRQVVLNNASGLISDFVNALKEDQNGNIWIGTRHGISLLNRKKFNEYLNAKEQTDSPKYLFTNFSYAEGFLGVGCNKNALFVNDDNELWVGCDDRLTVLRTNSPKKESVVPDVKIKYLNLFNEETDWIKLANNNNEALRQKNGTIIRDVFFDKLFRWENVPQDPSLAYNNNFLTFGFIAPALDMPQGIRYRFMLSGLDRNWNTSTDKTEANYGNLSPGNYVFRVYAINADGKVGKETIYPFTIRPPWWRTWWAYTLYILTALSAAVGYIRWRERYLRIRQKQLETKVEEATVEIRTQKAILEKEKNRSEELLLNILPEDVAEELKSKGVAEARQIDFATVLFTDFKGFTQIAERLTPKDLVHEIHKCFSAFDEIMMRHGVEKIKTIGDAYMAAGGIPNPSPTHAIDVVKAALELQQYMHHHAKMKHANNEEFFELRIGIHTGPVVAGIVGVKKFAYDIWGDTVNTASRIENSGEVGKVNISGATYEHVKDYFRCTYRGKIDAKGKGEIDMYFVDNT